MDVMKVLAKAVITVGLVGIWPGPDLLPALRRTVEEARPALVESWPGHHLKLYRAGATCYAVGARDEARAYLERFLEVHAREDDLRRRATAMLEAMGERGG